MRWKHRLPFTVKRKIFNMNIIRKANALIDRESKNWLCKKLGISRPTLNTRLTHDNWKNSEIQMILTLSK